MIADNLSITEIVMLSCPVRKLRRCLNKSSFLYDKGIMGFSGTIFDFLTGCDQAVVKRFKIGIADQCEFNGREFRELIL